jgi:hypothetical protein
VVVSPATVVVEVCRAAVWVATAAAVVDVAALCWGLLVLIMRSVAAAAATRAAASTAQVLPMGWLEQTNKSVLGRGRIKRRAFTA